MLERNGVPSTRPFSHSELMDVFMSTLQGTYFENMVGSILSNFSDVVMIGEHIENGLKTGRTSRTTSNLAGSKKPQSNFNKKKEGETNVVMANVQPQYQAPMALMPYYPFPYVVATQYQQPPFQNQAPLRYQ